jgi:hypothetical protein
MAFDSRSQPAPPRPHPLKLHSMSTRSNLSQRRKAGPVLDLQTQVPRESKSSACPLSATSLASPSLRAVRQYCLDHNLRTAFQANSQDYLRNFQPRQDFPRRHSVLSPAGLATHIDKFNVSTPTSSSPLSQESQQSPEIGYRADTSRRMLLNGINSSEQARLASAVMTRRSSLPQQPHQVKIPSEYTHDRLREWGGVYLGNADTADAFVKAVHLREPENGADGKLPRTRAKTRSKESKDWRHKSQDLNELSSEKGILIRAKVLPWEKERKPFIIQRRFNIEELRANARKQKSSSETENKQVKTASLVSSRRHSEDPEVEVYFRANSTPSSSRRTSHDSKADSNSISPKIASHIDRRIMPIRKISHMPSHLLHPVDTVADVEYALHYLPVLAALMLSGHVRKRDGIDLPLPYPEAWRETIAYIYTRKGEMTAAMADNIWYLAGNVDDEVS